MDYTNLASIAVMDWLLIVTLRVCYMHGVVSDKELQKLYKNFTKIDRDNSGTLEPEEFFDIPGKSSTRSPLLSWVKLRWFIS